MRRRHAFQPDAASAALEDRVVLTTAADLQFFHSAKVNGFLSNTGGQILSNNGGGFSNPGMNANNEAFVRAAAHMSRPQIRDAYVRDFQQIYKSFSNVYASVVNTVLLNNGSATSDQIAANRPAFDTAVQAAVNGLESNIVTLLALSPRASTSLIPAVQGQLTGSGTNSLLSQLNALTTPTDASGSTSAAFGTQSSAAISSSFQLLDSEMSAFARNPNFDFTNFAATAGSSASTTTGTTATGSGNATGTGAVGTATSTGTPSGTSTSTSTGSGTSTSVPVATLGSGLGTSSGVTSTNLPSGFTSTFLPSFNAGQTVVNAFGQSFNGFNPSQSASTVGIGTGTGTSTIPASGAINTVIPVPTTGTTTAPLGLGTAPNTSAPGSSTSLGLATPGSLSSVPLNQTGTTPTVIGTA